ncbi:MAG: response regulator transcription factor [Acidobacteria bacterium]|nr:response regulator transcription factor [Acidobacteriota bacterium]MCA1619593.1 response regulator transcription factor [Acidobacteriota bacterium]
MKLPRILIVEDEPDMALGLRDNCEYEGYEVSVARDGEEGVCRALADRPDLILLDVMLPKLSGLDVCRRLRDGGCVAPVIMLTARGQEIDKVLGLELGADDYVTKPFGVNELLARIRAHLRRAARPAPGVEGYTFGDVALNFRAHEATKAGRALELSAREFEILKYFVRRRGEPVTRDQLLDEVWGSRYPFSRTVDNHIAKLRQKIETDPSDPRFIVTLHRVGYKFLG